MGHEYMELKNTPAAIQAYRHAIGGLSRERLAIGGLCRGFRLVGGCVEACHWWVV